MKIPALLTVAVLSLSGCAETAYRITAASPPRDARAQLRDVEACDEDARINVPTRILLCGIGAAICRDVTDSRYLKCMRDRGYQLKPIG